MKKYLKFIFPIVCILVVVITFVLIFDIKNRIEAKNYDVSDIEEENTTNEILEEIDNNTENLVEENTVFQTNNATKNSVQNTSVVNEVEEQKNVITSSNIYEQSTDAGSTDKKQEAIEIVKQKWGEDSSVTFRCDSISGTGEYIIAVVSKSSATVKNYFRVNLEKRTAEIDY